MCGVEEVESNLRCTSAGLRLRSPAVVPVQNVHTKVPPISGRTLRAIIGLEDINIHNGSFDQTFAASDQDKAFGGPMGMVLRHHPQIRYVGLCNGLVTPSRRPMREHHIFWCLFRGSSDWSPHKDRSNGQQFCCLPGTTSTIHNEKEYRYDAVKTWTMPWSKKKLKLEEGVESSLVRDSGRIAALRSS
ncbi:LOW QUALITY PROTEIN: hypothetical protein RvY_05681 [Ramazzottius varieornatus]|uniref:Uncharacterized protein n=1 Tax=Ramazzottius varieornatus TaxID=947166 RepID=A0A1D1V2I6_RAMVA|nr:LOW QUALITY PROTEIN: hypothetical protein RvY_05681 [Ramazzottius varieornatus]